jgi:hypothetical protein
MEALGTFIFNKRGPPSSGEVLEILIVIGSNPTNYLLWFTKFFI